MLTYAWATWIPTSDIFGATANLWWFERQPTQASNHEYSYLGTFTSPAATC